jgi:hypothetical protein
VPAWATSAGRPGGVRSPYDPPLLRMGTLSKALGSLGGYVAGPRPYIDLLRNRARSFIFTTASTPADTAAGLAALRVVRSADGAALVARLRHLVDRVAPGHATPIVPIVVGEEDDAVAASAALLERGLLVPAIRPPTVAPGTSRLRLALSAAHTDEQVTLLLDALADLGLYRPTPVAAARPLALAALPGRPVSMGVGVPPQAPATDAPAEAPAEGARPAAVEAAGTADPAESAAPAGSAGPDQPGDRTAPGSLVAGMSANGDGPGPARAGRGGAVVVGLPVVAYASSATVRNGKGTDGSGGDRDRPGGGST